MFKTTVLHTLHIIPLLAADFLGCGCENSMKGMHFAAGYIQTLCTYKQHMVDKDLKLLNYNYQQHTEII